MSTEIRNLGPVTAYGAATDTEHGGDFSGTYEEFCEGLADIMAIAMALGGDLVHTFNGRKGAVTPQSGDYTTEMIDGDLVYTFNGRKGDVVPQAEDYTPDLIGAVAKTAVEGFISKQSLNPIQNKAVTKNIVNNVSNTGALNLFQLQLDTEITVNGITFTPMPDKSIVLNGTSTDHTEVVIWQNELHPLYFNEKTTWLIDNWGEDVRSAIFLRAYKDLSYYESTAPVIHILYGNHVEGPVAEEIRIITLGVFDGETVNNVRVYPAIYSLGDIHFDFTAYVPTNRELMLDVKDLKNMVSALKNTLSNYVYTETVELTGSDILPTGNYKFRSSYRDIAYNNYETSADGTRCTIFYNISNSNIASTDTVTVIELQPEGYYKLYGDDNNYNIFISSYSVAAGVLTVGVSFPYKTSGGRPPVYWPDAPVLLTYYIGKRIA